MKIHYMVYLKHKNHKHFFKRLDENYCFGELHQFLYSLHFEINLSNWQVLHHHHYP
jgi:hypothetical protein